MVYDRIWSSEYMYWSSQEEENKRIIKRLSITLSDRFLVGVIVPLDLPWRSVSLAIRLKRCIRSRKLNCSVEPGFVATASSSCMFNISNCQVAEDSYVKRYIQLLMKGGTNNETETQHREGAKNRILNVRILDVTNTIIGKECFAIYAILSCYDTN